MHPSYLSKQPSPETKALFNTCLHASITWCSKAARQNAQILHWFKWLNRNYTIILKTKSNAKACCTLKTPLLKAVINTSKSQKEEWFARNFMHTQFSCSEVAGLMQAYCQHFMLGKGQDHFIIFFQVFKTSLFFLRFTWSR